MDNHSCSHPCSGEKEKISRIAEEIDRIYEQELDRLREELTNQGIDITSGEGLKTFILAVRRLNQQFK
jgi:hypothetical protein